MMLMGEYQHNIDNKGRIIVPAKFRETLGETYILTTWLDHCLIMVSPDEWHNMYEQIKMLSATKRQTRSFVRLIFSSAVECGCDKQGRILIPAKLRKYAQLLKEVTFIGVSGHIEIWSSENWLKYSEEAQDDFVENAEEIGDILF